MIDNFEDEEAIWIVFESESTQNLLSLNQQLFRISDNQSKTENIYTVANLDFYNLVRDRPDILR